MIDLVSNIWLWFPKHSPKLGDLGWQNQWRLKLFSRSIEQNESNKSRILWMSKESTLSGLSGITLKKQLYLCQKIRTLFSLCSNKLIFGWQWATITLQKILIEQILLKDKKCSSIEWNYDWIRIRLNLIEKEAVYLYFEVGVRTFHPTFISPHVHFTTNLMCNEWNEY